MQGTPHDLSNSDGEFVKLLEEAIEINDDNDDDDKNVKEFRQNRSRANSKTSLRLNNSSKSLYSGDGDDDGDVNNKMNSDNDEKIKSQSIEQLQQMESSSKGQVHGSIALNYLGAGANLLTLAIIFILFLITQVFASCADLWVAFW